MSDPVPYPVRTKESPREILTADFKDLHGRVPIRGGWGYTREDPCVIDKNDPVVDQTMPFNGIGWEYIFVEKRIYEEMIICRPKGEGFSGIKWTLLQQNLIHDGNRAYDRLDFEITGFRDKDWAELKAKFEGNDGYGTATFDATAHQRKRDERIVRFNREFWFDITSFYGK